MKSNHIKYNTHLFTNPVVFTHFSSFSVDIYSSFVSSQKKTEINEKIKIVMIEKCMKYVLEIDVLYSEMHRLLGNGYIAPPFPI